MLLGCKAGLINILKQKSIFFIDFEPGFFNRKPARKFVENHKHGTNERKCNLIKFAQNQAVSESIPKSIAKSIQKSIFLENEKY